MNTNMIGYNQKKHVIDKDNLIQYISPQDIKTFGLIPELCGRFPVITHMNPLAPEDLKRILKEPKNALIKQYERLFELDGIKLTFAEDALDYIVNKAVELKLGARGLRSIIEKIMTNAMYDFPNSKQKSITITKKYAQTEFEQSIFSYVD